MGQLPGVKTTANRQWELAMLLPLADTAALAALLLLTPLLLTRLERLSGLNALGLSVAYVLFCTAVYGVQKLEADPASRRLIPASWFAPKLLAVLGVLFGLTMMFFFTYQMGYLEALGSFNSRSLNSGETAAFLSMAPGAWLGFSLFYTLLLISTFEPAVNWGDGRYRLISLLSPLTINLLLVLLTAQARAIVLGLGLNGQWLLLPVVFGFWLLLFGPPRLLILRKTPHLGGVISLLALLLYCAWLIVAA